jgi:Tol biopolymer transport system component
MTTIHASDRTRGLRPVVHVLRAALAFWLVGTALAPHTVAQNVQWAIWVMKPDGSQPRMLVQVDGAKKHCSPRWSHDGTRIAFAIARNDSWSGSEVYVVNADGSELKQVGEREHPAWSPDDKQIAMDFRSPDGMRNIFVQNLDGKGRIQVCQGEAARWSPDGSRLAVVDRGNVNVVDLVTGETVTLFKKRHDYIFHGFSWFPDGKRLAIVPRPGPSKLRHVFFVSADGEEHGMTERCTGGMGGYNSFSPDGKTLIFENHWTIHTLDVDGTRGPQQLPGQKGANVDPDWSPDGQWIVFASSRGAG